jgi:hypothetical protein
MVELRPSSLVPSFGCSLACAGDQDRDGNADALVGAWQHERGAEIWPVARATKIGPVPPTPHSESAYSSLGLGAVVDALDDLDGDSLPEFLVSCPSSATPSAFEVRSARQPRVLSAPAAELCATESSHIGVLARNVGDLDGDACADVLVGGATWRGAIPGVAALVSGRNGSVLRVWSRRSRHGGERDEPLR